MKTLHMCLLHALLPRQSGPLVSLQIPLVYINTLVFGLVYSGEESPNILSVKYAFSWVFMGIMELKELAVFQVLKELDSDDIKTMEISLISGYAKREFHSNADSHAGQVLQDHGFHQQMAHGRDQLLIIGSGIYEPAQP